MGYFHIGFLANPSADTQLLMGKISIDEFREEFQAELAYWSVSDYQQSWLGAIRRLLDGAEASCLVTSITDPETANFIVTWPLYRENETVFIQNKLLFLDELDEKFSPGEPWQSVSPRQTLNEDGMKISEWTVRLSDMRAYVDRVRSSFG